MKKLLQSVASKIKYAHVYTQHSYCRESASILAPDISFLWLFVNAQDKTDPARIPS